MFTSHQQNKVQQREAVENFFGNFIEPQLNISLQAQPTLPLVEHPQPQQTLDSLLIAVIIWFLCLGIHLCHLCQTKGKK